MTARATVVPFRPPEHPYAFDVSERDGGGRFVVHPDDVSKVSLWTSYSITFEPIDTFARVEPLPPLPWEAVEGGVASEK